ncbi:hypothetical protein [Brevundimonas diminuta]|uniref:hypothetical protein n=1 Tax=Brevundimonas diminuta TaxID=293 RepID=UPI003CFD4B0E
MAKISRGGVNPALAFIIGALVMVVAVLAWFLFGRGEPTLPATPNLNVDITAPAPPDLPKPAAPPTVVEG